MWKAPPSISPPQAAGVSMASPTDYHPPPLDPSFCFSTSTLKDFLRISRSHTDDTIPQQLNTLSQPPRFDPTSTTSRQPSHRLIPPATLNTYLTSQLYPVWSQRTHVLTYCTLVATSPDPNDPDASVIAEANEADKLKIVDERLDPYSGRYYPKETRTEILASVLRNERMVEEIVRDRSWEAVKGRSTDGMGGKGWREAFGEWEKSATG